MLDNLLSDKARQRRLFADRRRVARRSSGIPEEAITIFCTLFFVLVFSNGSANGQDSSGQVRTKVLRTVQTIGNETTNWQQLTTNEQNEIRRQLRKNLRGRLGII